MTPLPNEAFNVNRQASVSGAESRWTLLLFGYKSVLCFLWSCLVHPWVLVQLQVVVRLQIQGGSDRTEPPAAGDEGLRGGLFLQAVQVCSCRICVCVHACEGECV